MSAPVIITFLRGPYQDDVLVDDVVLSVVRPYLEPGDHIAQQRGRVAHNERRVAIRKGIHWTLTEQGPASLSHVYIGFTGFGMLMNNLANPPRAGSLCCGIHMHGSLPARRYTHHEASCRRS